MARTSYEPSKDLSTVESAVDNLDNLRKAHRAGELERNKLLPGMTDRQVKVLLKRYSRPWNTIYING